LEASPEVLGFFGRISDPLTHMRITEPMTMITDYLLAGWSVFLAISLLRKSRAARRGSVGLWVLAFLVAALAALAGGTSHGFRLYLGEANWIIVWTVTVWSIGAGSVLMLIAGLRSALRPETDNQRDRKVGVGWFWKGIFASAIGIALMKAKVSFHQHFNHNDLYHVIQMLGLWCFYRGAALLHGVEEPASARKAEEASAR